MKTFSLSRAKNKIYKPSNFGLHCHCAETKKHLLQLLKMSKQENVCVLVINNHKSLAIYTKILQQLSSEDLEPYKGMKLLPSIELPANFTYTNTDGKSYNIEIHILGYGVDVGKEELLQSFCSKKYKSINQSDELKRLVSIAHKLGLNFNDEDVYLDPSDDNRKFAARALMQGLLKNKDDNFCQEGEINPNKLPYALRSDWRGFHSICVNDSNSPFYLDMTNYNPDASEVIDLIHNMGGKAYLAHPSAYFAKIGTEEQINKAFREVVKFARDFIHHYSPKSNNAICIDGAEVYHPTYSGNIKVTSELKELVKQYRLGSSGGTDIHVDQTLGNNESVSSDSLGGKITRNKLRKFWFFRQNALEVCKLRKRVIDLSRERTDR